MTERKFPYSKQDFLNRKKIGDQMEAFVTKRLIDAGIDATQPFMEDGLPISDYTKYQKDIIANGHVLEVKGRNVHFTSVEDFPYKTIFVEGVGGFDKKDVRPKFYVNISHRTGAIIALDVDETFEKWTTGVVPDRARGFSFKMYISQTADWISFEELVRRLNVGI